MSKRNITRGCTGTENGGAREPQVGVNGQGHPRGKLEIVTQTTPHIQGQRTTGSNEEGGNKRLLTMFR